MAELSDKVGQTGDPTVIEEAALLAASVLPKAYALEYTQSQKALNQCREHSSKLLEKACVAVEKAAEKDGVHPDVLFQVARHWFQLHSEVPEAAVATSSSHVGYAANPLHYRALPPAAFNAAVPPPAHPTHYGHAQATQHPVPHGVPLAYMPAAHGQHAMPVPNVSYGYSVQHAPVPSAQRAPPQPNMVQPRLHVSHSAPNLQPGYGPPPLGHASNPYGMPGNHRQMIAHHPPDFATAPPPGRFPVNVTLQHPSISYNPHQRYGMAAQMPSTSAHHVQQQPAGHQYTSVMSVDSRKARLINAHRVGLRAMDMLAYRPADDNRCYVKFSENPKHGDDIRWLYDVSVELGVPYVIAFCEKAANSVASPFILFHLVKESAQFFGWAVGRHSYPVYHNASGPTSDFSQTQNRTTGAAQRVPSGQPGTSNSVGRALPLPSGDVGKCYSGQAKKTLLDQGYAPASADLMRQLVEMLYMAAFHKLNHPKFTESDADDVRQLVRVARESFSMLPPGQAKSMFIAYFHYMRKQKACKKEVSHMISSLFNNPYDS